MRLVGPIFGGGFEKNLANIKISVAVTDTSAYDYNSKSGLQYRHTTKTGLLTQTVKIGPFCRESTAFV